MLLFLIFFGTIGLYAFLVRRYQNSMRAWVSTVGIFVAHLQTLAIMGSLRLQWPPPVRQATAIFSLSCVDASVLSPECIASEGTNAFTTLALTQVSIILAFLILIGMGTVLCTHRWADRTHFLLTVVLSFFFATSWRIAYRMGGYVLSNDQGIVIAMVRASRAQAACHPWPCLPTSRVLWIPTTPPDHAC